MKLESNASITYINVLKLWEQNATLDTPNKQEMFGTEGGYLTD